MARRLDHVEGRPSAFQAGRIPSWRRSCERPALSLIAAACQWSLLLLSPLLSNGPAPGIRWQADPDRRAARLESRTGSGAAA
jgi:hypothetical protein